MNISEIRDKTKVELAAQGRDLRMELFNLKLQKASSQLEKPVRLRELRRDIARIETQVSQLGRKEALENLASALGQAKEFTVDSVAGALRGLAKGGRTRKDVLKLCGAVYNKQRRGDGPTHPGQGQGQSRGTGQAGGGTELKRQ